MLLLVQVCKLLKMKLLTSEIPDLNAEVIPDLSGQEIPVSQNAPSADEI
jgi:hypothetical protein